MTNRKVLSVMLGLALAASSVVIAQTQPVSADFSAPSPPEFTLQYVKYPYETQPQYTIDPYTGRSVVTSEGHHYENESIEVTIRNPQFTAYVDASGNIMDLFYSFRFRGHYGDSQWTEYKDYYYDVSSDNKFHHYGFFNSSDGDYTVALLRKMVLGNLPADAEVDIQVKTLSGYIYQKCYVTYMGDGTYPVFVGEESDWSNTQTISLSGGTTITNPSDSPQPTSTPTPTETAPPTSTIAPTQPDTQTNILPQLSWEQTAILVLVGVVGALLAGLVVLWRKVIHLSAANAPPEPPPNT